MTHDKLSIGVFVCSNGMGHIRRSIIIANTLAAAGHQVEMHLDKKKKHEFDMYKCKEFNYNCGTRVGQQLSDNWYKQNKIYGENFKYDVAISDNIIPVLQGVDAKIKILSGHFVWEKILNVESREITKALEQVINDKGVLKIASGAFASNYIKESDNYIAAKIYGKYTGYVQSRKEMVLISNGTAMAKNENMIKLISHIEKSKQCKLENIYVDFHTARYYSQVTGKDLRVCKMVNYDQDLLERVKIALIRPGIGTVSECLLNNVKLIGIYDKDDHEMKENKASLNSYFGEEIIGSDWKKAVNNILLGNIDHEEVTKRMGEDSFETGETILKALKQYF